MIELIGVSKSFGTNQVLTDISGLFQKGKVNLIIGQSGSGKTVLLKSIVGLHEVDAGKILYEGQDFTRMGFRERKAIRKEIGMVFQGGALFDSSTVVENVMYPLDMFTDWPYSQKLETANQCLNRVNIVNANHLSPAEISGGMKKRVAIARALALNPKYLFFDEPNSGLDPLTSTVIDKLILEITREYQTTTIINTHDMNSVFEIGEHVIFIYKGKKWWEGEPREMLLTDNPELNEFLYVSKLTQRLKGQLLD
jgi:phospholipid/cholesterol/gamma-HCH transport system ATP-binding protein